LILSALVPEIFLNCSLEEALAAFTTVHAVVVAAAVVTANVTRAERL
jgi:hypothetical protein